MYKAVILPPAAEDIKEAAIWYNEKKKGLGRRFTKAVRDKVLIIRKNPDIYPIRYEDTRTAVLDVFPFMIHYSVEHEDKQVLISAVFHTSRSTDIWKSR